MLRGYSISVLVFNIYIYIYALALHTRRIAHSSRNLHRDDAEVAVLHIFQVRIFLGNATVLPEIAAGVLPLLARLATTNSLTILVVFALTQLSSVRFCPLYMVTAAFAPVYYTLCFPACLIFFT